MNTGQKLTAELHLNMEGFRALTSTLNSHPGWINAELRRRRVSRRSSWSGPGPAGSELPASHFFLQDAAAADAQAKVRDLKAEAEKRRTSMCQGNVLI